MPKSRIRNHFLVGLLLETWKYDENRGEEPVIQDDAPDSMTQGEKSKLVVTLKAVADIAICAKLEEGTVVEEESGLNLAISCCKATISSFNNNSKYKNENNK